MRRRRADPDYRTRRVFGVPLSVVAQRGAGPLPAPITQALELLRRTALQQVRFDEKENGPGAGVVHCWTRGVE